MFMINNKELVGRLRKDGKLLVFVCEQSQPSNTVRILQSNDEKSLLGEVVLILRRPK